MAIEINPKYVRLPQGGQRCKISCFSRSYLYKLERLGQIKFFRIRQPGKKTGITMVATEDLLAFLEKQHASQEAKS